MRNEYLKYILILIVPLFLLIGYSLFSREKEVIFEILDETVKDIDGNIYKTVKIGEQIWMAENLKVTHYRDGTPIPNVYNNDKWQYATDGAYCMVENDSINYKKTYGVLYNFYAIANERGICPNGWRVPTEKECMILINFLGGSSIAGSKIKDNRKHLWRSKKSKATNESGFSGVPAGGRGRLGSPTDVGYYATWWSSTSHDEFYVWHWGVFPDKPGIRSNPGHKASGFSIRCIKDN